MRKAVTVLLFAVVLAFAATPYLSAVCESYDDSRVQLLQGEVVCAGSGPGCTECTSAESGGTSASCYMTTSGMTICLVNGRIFYVR